MKTPISLKQACHVSKTMLFFLLFATLGACRAGTAQFSSGSFDGNGNLVVSYPDTAHGELPLSRLIGGAAFNANAYWPPTGMTCAVTLDAKGSVLSKPPQAFTDNCAACHGALGQGDSVYPSVLKLQSFASFETLLRNGRHGQVEDMPAFPERWLNEDDLTRIYAYVTGSPLVETHNCQPTATMAQADVDKALVDGLAAWRKQDGRTDPNGVISNVACVQCHAADPLDLAYYGFGYGDILRRGAQHLPVDQVTPIVDMVIAQRQMYNIGRREPLVARPFQPGGGMLAGNSIVERDASFASQLQAMQLKIITSPIVSVDDAETAYSQLTKIDMHMLRIPVPFNHWAEDMRFNGDSAAPKCDDNIDACQDHGSLADWIPSAPHIPTSMASYLATSDAYLKTPNAQTYKALRQAIPSGDTMPGTYDYGTKTLDDAKYKAQALHNYCIRLELLGQTGCYDMGVAPFPNQADIWNVGASINLFGTNYAKFPSCDTGWTTCGSAPANLPQWPTHLLADITPGATLSSNFSRLRHPWMTLWWTHFDPTLLVTGDPTAQKDEYFTRSLWWSNLNDFQFSGTSQSLARPTYAVFTAWEVMMHNVSVLKNPSMSSCSLFPHTDFTCTAVDLRSGYYPNVINFAEQNQPQNPETSNNINYQVRWQPTEASRRAPYQMLVSNMYRMFFYRLIGALKTDPYICNPTLQRLRMTRAKSFLSQAETQKSVAAQDAAMFAELDKLLTSAPQKCPPLK